VTVCVVVPKNSVKEWENSYWKLADFVVPQSSEMIYEEGDQLLYNVTMFRKTLDAFKTNARERKFIVRDFTFSKTINEKQRTEATNLEKAKNKAYPPLIKWLKGNFSEAFLNWTHVKALRLFTESVLRYGLPATFMTAILEPNKKSEKKLREKLFAMYGTLDKNASDSTDLGDIPAMFLTGDYYPYVYFDINTAFVENVRDF